MLTAVSGLQWGDEGKGKITDYLAEAADCAVRYNGGANAGHTVEAGDQLFKFHQLPASILHRGVTALIANGSVVEPEGLIQEIEFLKERGYSTSRFFISDRAHVVMPYHRLLDGAEEALKGKGAIGTTGRGIGPCYSDKYSRNGIRVGDLLDLRMLGEKIAFNMRVKRAYASALGIDFDIDEGEIMTRMEQYASNLKTHIADTSSLIASFLKRRKNILFEGAHGILLDIDHGNYPFVTSSNTIPGGVYAGAGLPVSEHLKTVGVAKAYCTRVGGGPMPTELKDETGRLLSVKGEEVGTTTGRQRRCGWLDLFALKYAASLSGTEEMALTKLDVLTGLDRIEVATHYTYRGSKLTQYPSAAEILSEVRPVYRSFGGWKEELGDFRRYRELPQKAKDYIEYIEKYTGTRVKLISVGRKRSQTIRR